MWMLHVLIQCFALAIIQFTIKMDYTANKPARAREAGTRESNRNFSVHAVSPKELLHAYDSPSLDKPTTFARTSDKENVTLGRRYEGSLVRSPIDPLMGSRTSGAEEAREQRAEVEALLLEVAALRGMLLESSEQQAHELVRLKQGYEETNFLQMSSFRQKETSQMELYEFQMRKLKEQIAERLEDVSKLEVQLERERKSHEKEKETLKEDVRALIAKKNAQICDLKHELEERVRKVVSEKEQEIGDVKYNCSREIANINKILEGKTRELDRLTTISAEGEAERLKLLEKLQVEREEIERRYEQRIAQQYTKYENLKGNFNNLIAETTEMEENNWQQLQQMFNAEYANIFQLVRHKDAEVLELRKQMELEQASSKAQREAAEQECQLLKQKIKEQSATFQQEIELLKVKIAALHQADLEKVKELYELRLTNALEGGSRLQGENNKLRELLQQANAERYDMKQRHDVITSELNAKILKMRMGMHSLESDFKEKLENQKSLMLMTSRSFLKDAEVKTHNNKFLQEEIRKLRQLMDLQTRENENAEKAVEEKILAANNELERLSSKVVHIAQEKKQLEEAMDTLRKDKDRQIARLKAELNEIEKPQQSIAAELKMIEDLKEERNQKLEEIGKLRDKLGALQSRMKEMKAEVERANMEAQINHEQGKKQYHEIAQAHLSEFKKFYEEKLKRVEEEKEELKKIINSQYQQITELIKKYKQLEESMKDAVVLMKKRTVLEEKVMNLGMDNNLIKNLAQLLPGFPSQ